MKELNSGFLAINMMTSNEASIGKEITMTISSGLIISLTMGLIFIGLIGLILYRKKSTLDKILQEKTEALEYSIHHDHLTGLCNRNYMMNILQEELIDPAISFTALYVVNVVNLKIINDAYGHEIGDRILQHIARLLKEEFKTSDERIGMDHTEFLVFDSSLLCIEAVCEKANTLIQRLSRTTIINHMEIGVKVNVGISFAPDHSLEANLLLKKANIAEIQAVKKGPNHYHIFQSNLYKDALKRITLEKQLKRAVAKNEFEVFYQPRIRMSDMQVIGSEALIRWHHPDGKIVYPGNFIGLAESVGFISEITKWVVIHVARQVKVWETMGYAMKVSFNISGKEFDDDFLELLEGIIEKEQVNPNLLEVEITETATLEDIDYSATLVERLNDHGLSVALDDFGTGYSSMTYIKKLKAGKLKIDRSFIEDIDEYQQRAVVESMIQLGRKLDYVINVEGIETFEQLNILKEMDVDEVQGWYFSKAITADAFIDYVKLQESKVQAIKIQ